jgi:ribonuclease-3
VPLPILLVLEDITLLLFSGNTKPDFQVSLFSFFSKKKKYDSKEDEELASYILKITGNLPDNILLYQTAITHQSHSDKHNLKYNNERLEFLGDSVLDIVVSEYLYQKFPEKNEGELTRMRSTIVNRKSLNILAHKLELEKQIKTIVNLNQPGISLPGNALEAFVGAYYLDLGYKKAHEFIISGLIKKYLDLNTLEKEYENYKSTLLEWSQKESKILKFVVVQESLENNPVKSFKASALIDEELLGEGKGRSKKIAEQKAALEVLKKEGLK